jgi:cytochrome b561
MWNNTNEKFGLLSKFLHWLSAAMIIGLFALGYWMMGLEYDHPWYHNAPHWHKSVGILLILVTFIRIIWRCYSAIPKPIATHSRFTRRAGSLVHILLYGLICIVLLAGYMLAGTDGKAIAIFNWFSLPALGEIVLDQAELFGKLHEISAYVLMIFAVLHAVAALKHHFIDKDQTLSRMLK